MTKAIKVQLDKVKELLKVANRILRDDDYIEFLEEVESEAESRRRAFQDEIEKRRYE